MIDGNTYITRRPMHIYDNISLYPLEFEMFETKFVEKIILFSTKFFRKSSRLWDNVEKWCIAGEATDDNVTRRMLFACSITKSTNT